MAVVLGVLLSLSSQAAVPPYTDVRADWTSSDVRVLAADGQELQRVRQDFSTRRGDWVPLDQISTALQRAVIASEDHRFLDHRGVDWFASLSAAWSFAQGDGRRGASTITMQLAALLEPALQRAPGGRGLGQKWLQTQAALELESRWDKSQILEAYLNLAPWRGELVGVDALSRVLFSKRASGLTLRESALAAVMLRGPNAPVTRQAQRTCQLLRQLGHPEYCRDLLPFVRYTLARAHGSRHGSARWAPHWARFVIAQQHGDMPQELHTTLQLDLQKVALQAVHRHLRDMAGTGATDAAVVVLDNRSGAVLAYVGSSGRQLSEASEVDHALALRQAGSTLKPFLYAAALDQQRLTAASLLDDSPLNLDAGSGLYIPDNYDHQFVGWVSVRQALASSLNVPAVRTLMMVGPDAFSTQLRDLGLPLHRSGDYYGYSLALGSADVTLLSLANAYRTLAQGGAYTPIVLLQSQSPARTPRTLYSESAAWLVGNILADGAARARTFGLDSPLATRFWTAVKTGTSRDMRDNWCVGWSADYTVAVWVGNSAGGSMRHISGVSGAGPIWHDVMAWLHRRHGSTAPMMPAALTPHRVHFDQNLEPTRTEFFLGDTAQASVRVPVSPHGSRSVGMAQPIDGTILALDPDIPWSRQRQRLRAVDSLGREVQGLRWQVDGEPVEEDDSGVPGVWWAPRPGRHLVELYDAQNQRLDHARIEVRGGGF